MNIKNKKFLLLSNDVSQICSPLFEFIGVKNFDWIRTYSDGTKARLTTNPKWAEHYFNQDYYKDSQFERHPSLYRSGISIWDYVNSSPHHIDTDMENNFQRAHGLSILDVKEDFMDQFLFTTSPEKEGINSLYLCHMQELIKFTQYFLQKGSFLIEKVANDKIDFLFDSHTFYLPDGSSLLKTPEAVNFKEQIKIDKINVLSKDNKIVCLTKRETECLYYYTTGRTIKEIGKQLIISPRTVEDHLNNIRDKTGYRNLVDLADTLREKAITKNNTSFNFNSILL